MHRFKRSFVSLGVFFSVAAFVVAGVAYLGGQSSLVVDSTFVGMLLIALPFFLYRSVTVFSDQSRSVTHVWGFFPFRKTRQALYADIEKMVLHGRILAGRGGPNAQFWLRLLVRGSAKPILVADYDEPTIRREEPIIEAVSAATHIPLEKTAGYAKTRDYFDSRREGRNVNSKYALAASALSFAVVGYFALVHAGVSLPFQQGIQGLFTPDRHRNSWGQGVEVFCTILGFAAGLIGLGNYYQTR